MPTLKSVRAGYLAMMLDTLVPEPQRGAQIATQQLLHSPFGTNGWSGSKGGKRAGPGALVME